MGSLKLARQFMLAARIGARNSWLVQRSPAQSSALLNWIPCRSLPCIVTATSALHRRTWIAGFLALAFALRALLPQGFMPGAEPFTVQICPAGLSEGARQALASDPHAAHHAHDHGGHHQAHHEGPPEEHDAHARADQCPFAVASFAFALLLPATAVIDWIGAVDAEHCPDFLPPATSLRYRPQPRGPPVFS